MTILLIVIVTIGFLALFGDRMPTTITSKACKGHSWSWVEQPGLHNDDDEPITYLQCSKCKKTFNEILND